MEKIQTPSLTTTHWRRHMPWVLTLISGVIPLWIPRRLPIVDMPIHMHMVSVMHRLTDMNTLYPEYYQFRRAFTSYIGYYLSVDTLSYFMPIEIANRLFLSLSVISMPLSVAFLLRSLRRDSWPAILTIPFAYGHTLAWGFINASVSFTLSIFAIGSFVRSIEDPVKRLRWTLTTSILLLTIVLFHVLPFAFLGLAMPFLLITSSAPDGWGSKRGAILSLVPGVALLLFWILSRARNSTEIVVPKLWNEIEHPWKAVAPIFSTQNFVFKSLSDNLREIITFPSDELQLPHFPLFGSFLYTDSEHRIIFGIIVFTFVMMTIGMIRNSGPSKGGFRLLGLTIISTSLFFLLPISIRGYMGGINLRFAQHIIVFFIATIPLIPNLLKSFALWFGALSTIIFIIPLSISFHEFDNEWRGLGEVAAAAPPRVKIMGLIFDPHSQIFKLSVFIHSASEVAREQGGIPNFTFARHPFFPIQYRRDPPPTYPNEWLPQTIDWDKQGSQYDCFLLRGSPLGKLFDFELPHDLVLRKVSGRFSLYCRT